MEEKNVLLLGAPACSLQDANSHMESLNQRVDEICGKIDQLEHKINEVEQFYSHSSTKSGSTPKGISALKGLDRDKILNNLRKRQHGAFNRKAAAEKRMQDLMRQFGVILERIMEHKWATPFLQPVDVVGLGLHDYYEVIEKPMDFSTIKSKMEAKDGSGYKSVREICADVRLIFKNAMKYNDEKHDVHVMAKSLLDRFETRWLQLLPKVDEEERRLKDEDAEMEKDLQLAQEVQHSRNARDLYVELEAFEGQLEKLKETVLLKCRKMTTEEKKQLGSSITKLNSESINKALEIIAQSNPNFEASGKTVEVNIDAQSESTLWKLKFFVKETLQAQLKTTQPSTTTNGNVTAPPTTTTNTENNQNNRRKREGCDAIARNPQKKCRRLPG